MFSGYLRKPCPTDGCQNTLTPGQDFCTPCMVAKRALADQEDARWHEYALNGIRQLGRYLRKWAAFEDRYGPN